MEAATDFIIDVFFALERQVAAVADPYQARVAHIADRLAPAAMAYGREWLRTNKSVYAEKLPFMNPYHLLVMIAAYLSIVFVGSIVMRAMPGKWAVKTYALLNNLVLCSLSIFMFVEIVRQAFIGRYTLFGNGPRTPEENGWPMAKIVAVFYLSKFLEFNDTFIMVLKKNFHQVSFLHVYHHFSVAMIWWLVTFWAPNGDSYFSAMLNSFIHIIMYGYYFLTAIGVHQARLVKKYITSSQMTQFCCMMVQAIYNLADGYILNPATTPEAKAKQYPLELSKLLFVYMITMLSLFANFFRQDRKRDAARRAQIATATKDAKPKKE